MTSDDASYRRAAFERRHGGCVEDERTIELLRIVWHLTDKGWEGPTVDAKILRSDRPNGFVLASGHLYVTSGLMDLTCTDDDLAAVVAHELAHLQNPGGFRRARLSGSDRLAVEVDADFRAALRLMNANYDPAALAVMIERLADQQPEGWAAYRGEQLETLLGNRVVMGRGMSAASATEVCCESAPNDAGGS